MRIIYIIALALTLQNCVAHAGALEYCQKLLAKAASLLNVKPKISPEEELRRKLAPIQPTVTRNGSIATLGWAGIEDRIRKASKRLKEPEAKLNELTVSIYVNGVETVSGIPFGQSSHTFGNPEPLGQVDYYIVYKRGETIVDISEFALKETDDGQQLQEGSFTGKFSGELFGFELSDELLTTLPSPELTSNSVKLGYKKIVWVLSPDATKKTQDLIANAQTGVDIRVQFGPKGMPISVTVIDRKTRATVSAPPEDFFFKVDAAFNGNAFFWDDMLVSLATVPHHPWLAQSTIRFWLMVQARNGGTIPREVRKSNLISLWFPERIRYGEETKPNLTYTNPYLMNWVMDELYRYSPTSENKGLLKRVARSMEDYTQWMEKHRGVRDGSKIIGFNGSALGTGADNSRGRLGNAGEERGYKTGFIDFMAQQIRMYKDIARWNALLAKGENNQFERNRLLNSAMQATAKADEYTATMNTRYWNSERCFYYDLVPDGPNKWRQNLEFTVIGGFWPLWAGVPNAEQVKCMIEKQMVPKGFGGEFPFPANARETIKEGLQTDPLYIPRPYREEDGYWDKWAHWPPMVMAAIEGFRRAGHLDLAYNLSVKFLNKIGKWSTKTVEESYGEIQVHMPDGRIAYEARAIQHATHPHRPDFAGWGKGPPVYMLLNHVLGLRPNDQGVLEWNLMVPLMPGQSVMVKNLQYRGSTINKLQVTRTADGTYELLVDGVPGLQVELNLMRDRSGRLQSTPLKKSGPLGVGTHEIRL